VGYLEKYMQARSDEFMSHIRPAWLERLNSGEPISLAEWQLKTANSYERSLAYSLLTNEALIHVTKFAMANCSIRQPSVYTVPTTYDDLLLVLTAELATRLESLAPKE